MSGHRLIRVNKLTEDCGRVVNGPYSRIRGRESGHDYENGYGPNYRLCSKGIRSHRLPATRLWLQRLLN